MKKIILLPLYFLSVFLTAAAQQPAMLSNSGTIYTSKNTNVKSYVNGSAVTGVPFLFEDWTKGFVTMQDGKTFENYDLKYNIENQTLFFLNGSETFEIDQKIKEFNLLDNFNLTRRFIYGDIFGKNNKNFYEVAAEHENSQLLILYIKKPETTNEKFTAITSSKYYVQEIEYFVFDKAQNKLLPYRKAGAEFRALYKLN